MGAQPAQGVVLELPATVVGVLDPASIWAPHELGFQVSCEVDRERVHSTHSVRDALAIQMLPVTP